jgi:quercetin dioxygenase-like cupin family protein
MIKKSTSMKPATTQNSHDGKGEVTRIKLLEEADFLGKGRLFNSMELEPGSSIGLHEHKGEQEIYYIMKGKAMYNDNGTVRPVEAGDVTICPSGESHGIEAIGDETLKVIALILFT